MGEFSPFHWIVVLVVLVALVFPYFIPTIVGRKKKNAAAVFFPQSFAWLDPRWLGWSTYLGTDKRRLRIAASGNQPTRAIICSMFGLRKIFANGHEILQHLRRAHGFMMLLNSAQEVESRLRTDTAKLTPDEVRSLIPWMNQISEVGMRRLNSELALQNLEAVEKFDKSSSRLTWCLIGLTFVLISLTVVIAFYTVVLARKPYADGRFQRSTQDSMLALDTKTGQLCRTAGPTAERPTPPLCSDLK